MNQVSRPLLGLLLAVVVFFALWMLVLKPGSSATNATAPGVAGLSSAVAKAHQAVASSDAASAAHGGTVATTPAATPVRAAAAPATVHSRPAPAKTATTPSSATSQRLGLVERALVQHRVVALLFYNSRAADDRAVRRELSSVPLHAGRVVRLAVPISELSHYPAVTNQVPVAVAPTLVLIDPDRQATTIVGFADRFEIAQRVSDALRVP
jgi:hypothetical protein